jgi:hypothetical protein
MPFELGLAVAWAQHVDKKHRWFVFESKVHRAMKSLSDINGTEIYVHDNRPIGVLRGLTNALARSHHRPTVLELQAIYRDVKRAAVSIKRELMAQTLFDTRPFLDLVLAASISAKRRISSLRD